MRQSDNNKQDNSSFVNARGLNQSVLVLPIAYNTVWTTFDTVTSKIDHSNIIFRINKQAILREYSKQSAVILRPEEIDHSNRIKNKKSKENYLSSKLALRIILGRQLDLDPYALRFKRNRWGKPALLNQKLHFNISHSDKWLILALSKNQRIGVDLEQYIPAFDYKALVDAYFHPSEKEVLKDTYSLAQKTFFRLWTRKEALAKVIGLGLHEKLLATNMLETAIVKHPKKISSFFVIHSFHVDNQHVAAFALRSQVNPPIFYNFL